MAYTGVYERTIFYNPVNKYSVISVKTSDRSIPEKARSAYRHRDNMIHFAAVGYELPRTDQVSMILDGEWKEGKNGVQLHVTQCEEVVPQTREGIKGYLSSRLIKGIGGKTAELIVDRFGADTLNVLENEPERLLEIRGVSKAKLEEIIASYNESRALRDLMLLLAPFQITPTTATKIYDHFGARSVDILRDNPFELCQVSGFGFKRVDAIMRKNNWPLNSPMRIRGAVFAALESAKGDGGHLYLEAEQLHKEAMSLLNSMIPVPQMRVAVAEVGTGLTVQNTDHTLGRRSLQPCVDIVCQKSGVFAAHSLIVLGGDAQVRTDLPVGNVADLQRFDTVCAITVQHMERQIVAVALKTKVAGIDHIILFGILLPGDLRGKLFQRQACFHGSTLLTSSVRWHHPSCWRRSPHARIPSGAGASNASPAGS